MQFEKVDKNRWEAWDSRDRYEIVKYRGEYCCIKNESIWFDTVHDLETAVAASNEEQAHQEWHSNNPENEQLNRRAREQRERERRVPKLWRGR